MDVQGFYNGLKGLGQVYVVVYGKGVFAEGRTTLAEPKFSERYVMFSEGLEMHISLMDDIRVVFGEGLGLYSKKFEYWIKLKSKDDEDLLRISLLKEPGAEEYNPEHLAAYQELKAAHG